MTTAFLCALGYWIAQSIDRLLGWQTVTRPIIMGPLVGTLLGDTKTGIILGAELEAIFMGISGIGGVSAANYQATTAITTGLVITTGIDIATGAALAAAMGSVLTTINNINKILTSALHPVFIRLAEAREYKKFNFFFYFQGLFLGQILAVGTIFLVMVFGQEFITLILDKVPPFILGGLKTAGGMLVVVGLAITTQMIWSAKTALYVILGFSLAKYVGLGTLPIAVFGIILAVLTFYNSYELNEMKNKGGDDFYG